ncbi:hypothetical protein [Candidatus Liberibacter solanacearum]|nr:hypothetical protein [Candidatus Liberibacter solanacearum]
MLLEGFFHPSLYLPSSSYPLLSSLHPLLSALHPLLEKELLI